jgi:hypothetical protein
VKINSLWAWLTPAPSAPDTAPAPSAFGHDGIPSGFPPPSTVPTMEYQDMTDTFTCGRRYNIEHDTDSWRPDNTCSYCGSLSPEVFMARLDAGDVELGPTDKNYKVYVANAAGAEFGHFAKFYFQHLSEAQQIRFVELLNAKRLKFGMPGHFYRLPYFITPKVKA